MATTYYLSSDGNDSPTRNGTSPSRAWQSIGKINGVTLNPGDTVCFRCGDTWNETLLISSSGAPGAPITWTSYSENGIKTPPVISGFKQIGDTDWSTSGDIRSATVPGSLTRFNVVSLGTATTAGVNQPVGRYPAAESTAGTWNRTINIFFIATGAATIFTAYNHGLALGDTVTFSSTGTLPTSLLPVPTKYYVVVAATDTFQISATPGGSPLSTSGSYTGTVTAATPSKTNYNMVSSVLSLNFTAVSNSSSFSAAAIPAGFTAGITAVALYSTMSLPGGITAGQTYYVVSINQSNNTFQLSASPTGTPVTPTTAGTGVLSLTWGITDDALNTAPSAVDFAGGEIVIRKASWILDRGRLTGSTLFGSLNYAGEENANTYKAAVGWGYFIQNHPGCLKSLGDWCYDATANLFSMYFGGHVPSGYVVKVPMLANNVLILSGRSYHTFKCIHFEGANQSAVSGATKCSSIEFVDCIFSQIGQDAINFACDTNSKVSWLNISGCTFSDIANNGIILRGPNNCIITACTFDNVHDIAGMGKSGDGNGYAISLATPDPAFTYNNVVTGNKFSNCGYVPVGYTGSSCLIQYNYIDHYCYIKDDGGGIYGGSDSLYRYSQRYILNNVILDGTGAPAGKLNASPAAHGIYTDDYSTDVSIFNNTVAHIQAAGLMIHNSNRINIQGNILYDCMLNHFEPSTKGIVHMMSDTLKVNSGTLQDIIFKGNVVWNTQALPYLFLNINKDASSNLTMASDYNFYHSPLTFDKFFFLKQLFASGAADKTVYNLHTWGGAFGRDINSRDKMPMGLNYGYTLNTPAKVTQSFFDSNGNIAPSGLPGTIRTQSNCDFSKDDIKLGSGALTVTPHDPTKLTTFYINLGDTTSDPDDVQYIITFNITGSQDGFLFIDIDRTFKLDIGRINVVETKVSATSNVCLMKNNVTAPAQLLQITIPIGVGAITINNLNVYTGTLTPPDISNLRFECNPTPSQASITLDRNYYDAAYNFYPAGDFTMEPFSSLILTPAVSAVIKM